MQEFVIDLLSSFCCLLQWNDSCDWRERGRRAELIEAYDRIVIILMPAMSPHLRGGLFRGAYLIGYIPEAADQGCCGLRQALLDKGLDHQYKAMVDWWFRFHAVRRDGYFDAYHLLLDGICFTPLVCDKHFVLPWSTDLLVSQLLFLCCNHVKFRRPVFDFSLVRKLFTGPLAGDGYQDIRREIVECLIYDIPCMAGIWFLRPSDASSTKREADETERLIRDMFPDEKDLLDRLARAVSDCRKRCDRTLTAGAAA